MVDYGAYYVPAKKKEQENKKPVTPGMMKKEEIGPLLDEAIEHYGKAVKGDKEAAKTALELLKRIHLADTSNCRVEAYLGAATALQGRDILDPIQRFKLAMKGLKMLDHAVACEAGNIEFRRLRGQVCFKLPEMYFHRTATAIEDFSYMIAQYEENHNIFTADEYSKLLFDLGTAYQNLNRTEDANKIFSKLLSITDDPKYKGMIEQVKTSTAASPNAVPAEGEDKPKKKVWKML